jgi:hypothetical protein
MLDPQMFALVDAEDDRHIFAYGVDTGEEAFTFRRDPVTNRADFGVSEDADAAYRLAARMTKGIARVKLVRYEFSAPLADEFVDDEPPAPAEYPPDPSADVRSSRAR